jgi:hypothetical protein
MNYSEKEILEFELIAMKDKTPTKEKLPEPIEYGKGKRSCQIFFKNCICCNTLFTAKRKSQKYCSNKCAIKYRYESNKDHINKKRKSKGYDKECSECGSKFHTQIKHVKTCSNHCRKLSQLKIKECLYCNTRYKLGDGKYCSSMCRENASQKPKKHCRRCSKELLNHRYTFCSKNCRKTKKEFENIDCVWCGTSFKKKTKKSKFCSKNCNKRYYNDLYKKNNPKKWKSIRRECNRLRKRAEKQAKLSIESWSDIAKFIESRPSEHHELDHIIPLNHANVCGLHNTWNFQWLSKEDNAKKSNNFDGTMENISWKNK